MKNSTFWSIAVVIVVVVVAFSVVGYHYRAPQPQRGEIVIHDALGTKFVFQQPLTRIVSLDPSATVTLYALGAYKDLVGGNPFDYYPPNETLPNVGNSFSVNYEELVNLSPQAVLGYGTTMPSYGYTINNTLDIPFILDNPESFSQIENFTLMLGELTGTESNASKIVDWMNESIDAIDSALSQIHQRYTVFYYLYAPGDWTAGNGTFLNQIFQYSGLINIATAPGYYEVNPSFIANATANNSPQVILLDQYVNYSNVQVEPFNSTPAYIDHRVYTLFNDSFFNEPDFRIMYAIQWLIYEVYHVYVQLPQFPIALKYPPTLGMPSI